MEAGLVEGLAAVEFLMILLLVEEKGLAAICLARSTVSGLYEGRFVMVKKKKALLKARKEKVVKE